MKSPRVFTVLIFLLSIAFLTATAQVFINLDSSYPNQAFTMHH